MASWGETTVERNFRRAAGVSLCAWLSLGPLVYRLHHQSTVALSTWFLRLSPTPACSFPLWTQYCHMGFSCKGKSISKTFVFLPLTIPDTSPDDYLRQAVQMKFITINDGDFLRVGRVSRELCFLN